MKSLDLQHVRKRCPLPYLSNVYKVLSDVFDLKLRTSLTEKKKRGHTHEDLSRSGRYKTGGIYDVRKQIT